MWSSMPQNTRPNSNSSTRTTTLASLGGTTEDGVVSNMTLLVDCLFCVVWCNHDAIIPYYLYYPYVLIIRYFNFSCMYHAVSCCFSVLLVFFVKTTKTLEKSDCIFNRCAQQLSAYQQQNKPCVHCTWWWNRWNKEETFSSNPTVVFLEDSAKSMISTAFNDRSFKFKDHTHWTSTLISRIFNKIGKSA